MKYFGYLFSEKDNRKKMLYLLLFLGIYQVLTFVPVPGVNRDVLSIMFDQNKAFDIANVFTGGALKNFSILAIGIMPYITASIVIQLLSMDVIPHLSELRQQGAMGQKSLKKITYYVAFVVSFIQSFGMAWGFNRLYPGVVTNTSWYNYLLIAGCLTLGTGILLVLSWLIDKKGIGKGISMIIAAGILMSSPRLFYQIAETIKLADNLFVTSIEQILYLVAFFVMMWMTVQVQRAERRLPIQYANHGQKQAMAKNSNYLPIKLNMAGVIPVIFASSIVMTPITIAQMYKGNEIADWIVQHLTYTEPLGMVLFVALIMFFTYFYAFVQTNPEKLALDIQRSGGFLPGVRPGTATSEKIAFTMKHLSFAGALFLALLAVAPIVTQQFVTVSFLAVMGGTSLIIMVSVFVDMKSQITVTQLKNNYKSFF